MRSLEQQHKETLSQLRKEEDDEQFMKEFDGPIASEEEEHFLQEFDGPNDFKEELKQ